MSRNTNEQIIYDARQLIAELPTSPVRTQLILATCRAEHPGILGTKREDDAINLLATL